MSVSKKYVPFAVSFEFNLYMKNTIHLILTLTVVFLILTPAIFAESKPDTTKIRTYPHLNKCIEQAYMASDSVRLDNGMLAEIAWLRENRTNCEFNSAVTRRLSLRLMELGDGQYGDEGLEIPIDRKKLFAESLDWARIAVFEDSTDDINFENLSMAFAARLSVAGLRGKSLLADSVRMYAEKAVEINPDNHRAYHILGRWHYEVSKLSWILRKLSKILFKHSPSGSFNLAVEYFNKAITLNDIPVHHYWLGMSYLESGKKQKALETFTYLLELEDDGLYNAQYFKERAKKLIKKHG